MNVTPRKWYVVTTDSECVVTDANGKVLCTATAGEQKLFFATTPTVTLSDETATVGEANFKRAALALGLLGGGNHGLPAGYTRVYFLESSGAQSIDGGIRVSTDSTVKFKASCQQKEQHNQNVYGGTVEGLPKNGFGFMFCAGYQYPLQFSFNSGRQIYKAMCPSLGKVYAISQNSEKVIVDGTEYLYSQELSKMDLPVVLFARLVKSINKVEAYSVTLRLYSFEVDKPKKISFVPAIDNTGAPCMYDIVSRKPFRNSGSGQFIVGFTLAQARKLGKLAPNSKLTISLPVGYDGDEVVVAALAKAADKGCVLTVQTYEEGESAAASTYALRRVWVRRWEDEAGSYVDADGQRWQVEWCVDVVGADPESLGFERFRAVDAAREFWGLVDYVAPDAEELLTAE